MSLWAKVIWPKEINKNGTNVILEEMRSQFKVFREILEHISQKYDAILETGGHYFIARNPSKEKSNLPGIQQEEFMVLPAEKFIETDKNNKET